MHCLDARSGYDRLFNQILHSNAIEDRNLRLALSNVLTLDIANDIDGVITYVTVHKQISKRKRIPSYLKTIYVVVTSMSIIQGDGLYGWLIENHIQALQKLCVAIKKIGLLNAFQVLNELYRYISDNFDSVIFEPKNSIVVEQIEMFETRLMKSLKNEDITAVAQKYLDLNKNTGNASPSPPQKSDKGETT